MAGCLVAAVPSVSSPALAERRGNSGHLLNCANAQYFIVMARPACYTATSMHTSTYTPSSSPLVSRELNMSSGATPPEASPLQETQLEGLLEGAEKDSKKDKEGEEWIPNGVAIITLDAISGQCMHAGVPSLDLFHRFSDALRAVPTLCPQSPSTVTVHTVSEFVAFAGACLTAEALHLLLVESHTRLADANPLPLFAVTKAQWYTLPLRIAVPALQGIQSSVERHGMNSSCSSGSAIFGLGVTPVEDMGTLHDTRPPLPPLQEGDGKLYYAPGMDVSHCEAVTAAMNSVKGIPARLLPPLSPPFGEKNFPTVGDALGRGDCLWNESLIAHCALSGLGDWCCRLAFGSCTTVPLTPYQSGRALLLVRLSRLATPGCVCTCAISTQTRTSAMTDEKNSNKCLCHSVSVMETEFQLLLPRETGDGVASLVWRRGSDFAGHPDLLAQRQRFAKAAASLTDPMPPHGDVISAIFAAYLARYGPSTHVQLVHAGGPALQDAFLVRDSRASSPKHRETTDIVAVDTTFVDTALTSNLDELAAHVHAHSLRPSVEVGADASRREENPSDAFLWLASAHRGKTFGEEKRRRARRHVRRICIGATTETDVMASLIVSAAWTVDWLRQQLSRKKSMKSRRQSIKKMESERQEENPIGGDEDREIHENCHEMQNSANVEEGDSDDNCTGESEDMESDTKQKSTDVSFLEFVQENESLVHNVIRALAASEAASLCTRRLPFTGVFGVFSSPTVASRIRQSIVSAAASVVSPLVWATAQRLVGGVHAENATLLDPPLLAFLTSLFPRMGRFIAADAAASRPTLLTHPANLAVTVAMQLLASPHDGTVEDTTNTKPLVTAFTDENGVEKVEESRRPSLRFPFTPMRPIAQSASSSSTISASALLLGGLVHPDAAPLLLPATCVAAEWTIALPSMAHVTHIALAIGSAVQESPYAAPLTLSLATSCYLAQAHERPVLAEVSLPLCVNRRPPRAGIPATPHYIFFELYRGNDTQGSSTMDATGNNGNIGPVYSLGTTGGLYNKVECSTAGLNVDDLDDTAPVLARFLRFTLRGSGVNQMAAPPVLAFGVPLERMSSAELDAVLGHTSVLRRALSKRAPPYLEEGTYPIPEPLSVTTGDITDECYEMYVHKICSLLPGELSRFSLAHALEMEAKRLQCRVPNCEREWCLQRLGAPRWITRPALQVFPHFLTHRSRLPDDEDEYENESVKIQPDQDHRRERLGKQNGHRKEEASQERNVSSKRKASGSRHQASAHKVCAVCHRGFSWFATARECEQCHCIICDRCALIGPVRLIESGLRETMVCLCRPCRQRVTHLESLRAVVEWSANAAHERRMGCAGNESIDFYSRWPEAHPCASFMSSVFMKSGAGGGVSRLTALPWTRVVTAPRMSDLSAPPFESTLAAGGPGAAWRCVSAAEWTDSTTRVRRYAVVLLPHTAAVAHATLHYTFDETTQTKPSVGGGAVEVELHMGLALQTLRAGPPTPIHRAGESEIRLDVYPPTAANPIEGGGDAFVAVRLVALFFTGAVADLARLRVNHFAVWGHFVTSSAASLSSPPRGVFHRVRADGSCYGPILLGGCNSNAQTTGGGALLGLGCLPRMLAMTRLIPLRAVVPHTRTELFIVEFDFGVPAVVCGFTLELHHPVYAAGAPIATALRLIGVSSSGQCGNMGFVQLPWPPLTPSETSPQEVFSYAYGLPSPNYDIVAVMVEAAEWRCAGSHAGRDKFHEGMMERLSFTEGMMEQSGRRTVFLGKMQFWTSANTLTRQMVSSGTFASIHAKAEDMKL